MCQVYAAGDYIGAVISATVYNLLMMPQRYKARKEGGIAEKKYSKTSEDVNIANGMFFSDHQHIVVLLTSTKEKSFSFSSLGSIREAFIWIAVDFVVWVLKYVHNYIYIYIQN